MKVAIPISRFDSSGGIRVLTILANGLALRGHCVVFVVPRGSHESHFTLHPSVKVHVVGPDFGISLVGGLLKKIQLALGGPKGVDISIANAFMTAYSVWFKKKISTCRGFYFIQAYEPLAFGTYSAGPGWLKFLKKKFAEWTYSLGLECITNSKWTTEMVSRHHGITCRTASLGVNIGVFNASPRSEQTDEFLILVIGNNNPIKRFALALEVAELVQKKISSKLLIATQSPFPIDRPGLRFEFVSPRNDEEMANVYRKASVFLSTSAWEGFGLALLEAMACGTPVVTTDAGGIRDFCEDRVNSRIVASAHAPDLAQAILELHSDEATKSHLVKNAIETASERNWDRLIDRFDEMIKHPEESGK